LHQVRPLYAAVTGSALDLAEALGHQVIEDLLGLAHQEAATRGDPVQVFLKLPSNQKHRQSGGRSITSSHKTRLCWFSCIKQGFLDNFTAVLNPAY